MQCHELGEALSLWLDNGVGPFPFSADSGAVCLWRLECGILTGARLMIPVLGESLLQEALSLGLPSLGRFPGALAREPVEGQLWLLHRLDDGCTCDDLLASLETLLNQRDTWQSILAGEASSSSVKSRPLSLLPSSIGGTHYA